MNRVIICLLFLLVFPSPVLALEIIKEVHESGVTTIKPAQSEKPFWSKVFDLGSSTLEEIFKGPPPFDRSVALVVGVSEYTHSATFEPLPKVKETVISVAEALIENGFDEVRYAVDGPVSADWVRRQLAGAFPLDSAENDRLLLYFVGHGKDYGGDKGYFLFKNAEPQAEIDALPISTFVEERSVAMKMRHVLFVFDCCAAGMGFMPMSDKDDSEKMSRALSGRASRSVILAGTGDQETYVSDTALTLFSQAFIAALESTDSAESRIMTENGLTESINKWIARYPLEERYIRPRPQCWRLMADRLQKGTLQGLPDGAFIFYKQNSKGVLLPSNDQTAPDVLFRMGEDNQIPRHESIMKEREEIVLEDPFRIEIPLRFSSERYQSMDYIPLPQLLKADGSMPDISELMPEPYSSRRSSNQNREKIMDTRTMVLFVPDLATEFGLGATVARFISLILAGNWNEAAKFVETQEQSAYFMEAFPQMYRDRDEAAKWIILDEVFAIDKFKDPSRSYTTDMAREVNISSIKPLEYRLITSEREKYCVVDLCVEATLPGESVSRSKVLSVKVTRSPQYVHVYHSDEVPNSQCESLTELFQDKGQTIDLDQM